MCVLDRERKSVFLRERDRMSMWQCKKKNVHVMSFAEVIWENWPRYREREREREREMEEILRGRESALTDVKDTWMDVWKGDDLFVRKLFKSK